MVPMSVDESLAVRDLIEAYDVRDIGLGFLTPKLITMAKLAKKKQTAKGLRFEVVNPNAAGIDISPKEMLHCRMAQGMPY